ncbi:MAG: translocation/assembly module TamB [Chlamydiae bacterium]|nr:translocation/assembly module TamB [Chlamydiota bacterium]
MKRCCLFLSIFISLVLALWVWTQTGTFQSFLTRYLTECAEQKQIKLEIEGLSCSSPLEWSLQQAHIQWEGGSSLNLREIKFRIALLPLLRGELSIRSLDIDKALFQGVFAQGSFSLPRLPLAFYAKSFHIQHLVLQRPTSQELIDLCIEGKLRADPLLHEVQCDLLLSEPSSASSLLLQGSSSKKKDLLQATLNLHLLHNSNLSSFLHLPWCASLDTTLRCHGSWTFWSAASPLTGDLTMELLELTIPSKPLWQAPWRFTTEITFFPGSQLDFHHFSLQTSILSCQGDVQLTQQGTPLSGHILFHIPDIQTLTSSLLSGPVEGQVDLTQEDFSLITSALDLKILEESFPAKLQIHATKDKNLWSGSLHSTLEHQDLPCQGEALFAFGDHSLQVDQALIKIGSSSFSGEGTWTLFTPSWKGTLFVQVPDLKPFRIFFKESNLEGRLGGSLTCLQEQNFVSLELHSVLKNVRYDQYSMHEARIDSGILDLLCKPKVSLSVEGEQLLFPMGRVSFFSLSSSYDEQLGQLFTLALETPQEFSFSSQGNFYQDDNGWKIHCQQYQGSLLDYDILGKNWSLGRGATSYFLQGESLQLGEGSLSIACLATPTEASLKTKATKLPLSLLSFIYPEWSFQGLLSFDGHLLAPEGNVEGSFLATLDDITLPTKAKGSLQVHCTSSLAQVHTLIEATQGQFIEGSATLPITCTLDPFSLQIPSKKPLSINLTLEGAIEDLFFFLQRSSQEVRGWLSSHLLGSGSLEQPSIQGTIQWEQGTYENYPSHTKLHDIQVSLLAEGSTLRMKNATGHDLKQGSLTCSGELSLLSPYTFSLQASLQDLQAIDSDSLHVQVTGPLYLQGDQQGAELKGELHVEHALFTLSDALLVDVPTLPIHYIHKPIHMQNLPSTPSCYPLELNLQFQEISTLHIQGKGLDSAWKGDLLLQGLTSQIQGKGSLTLEKGTYVFAGKTFTLTQGTLTFFDKPDQETQLTLTGELPLKETTLLVMMQGPLSHPKVTFQSTPPLPTSSILSLILFDKDISEISPFQALQLAQVIVSLSGGGPDVLEAIRKTIGVDRFSITGKEGTDEIVLQVGWYLTHGITVSLSQSATSSDVTVEVDLKNGFVFEMETQNQEEGKFSLKWHNRY